MKQWSWFVFLVACGVPSSHPPPVESPPIDRTWSEPAALAYLADRSNDWLDHRPCALSCHTTHAFMLLGTDVGGVRRRIVDEELARIWAWPQAEAWYSSDDTKVAESRGTESVLAALAVAGTSDAGPAIDLMLDEQRPSGGWYWLDFDLAPWETDGAEVEGAAFAALAIARSPEHRADPAKVGVLRAWLVAQAARGDVHLHNKLSLLWASTAMEGVLTSAQRTAFAAEVRAMRRADGGFALADLGPWRRKDGSANRATASDGYATGFVAYVLSLVDDGASTATIADARRWLATHQDAKTGAWPATSLNDDDAFNRGLITDAATAYAVLALRGR